MKTFKFLAVAAVVLMAVMSCGPKKSAYEKMVAEVKADPELKALESSRETMDTVSYLLGLYYGSQIKGHDFFDEEKDLNMDEFKKGMSDIFKNGFPSVPYGEDEEWAKKFKINPYENNRVFNEYLAKRRAYTLAFNQKLGERFLADNQKKDGVQVSESGLQYIIHAEGEGAKVKPEDRVLVNYKGTLLDGTEFDANDSTEFVANQVIRGWTEGLGLLGKGGHATLFIPSELAYGERGAGPQIKPNSTLIFDVEVLDIISEQTEETEAAESVVVENVEEK